MRDTAFQTIYLGDDIECAAQVAFFVEREGADTACGFSGGHDVTADVLSVQMEDPETWELELLSREEVIRRFGKSDLLRAERELEDAMSEALNRGDTITSDEDAIFEPRDFEFAWPIAAE
ncbi:MAG: hypothetical protein EpisKO_06270 [Epibacterium sp.]